MRKGACMSRTITYTQAHEEFLKRIADGMTLDEVLTGSEIYRDGLRGQLCELSLDCTITAEENKLAEDLDAMLLHFKLGDCEATWEDDYDWVPGFEAYLREHEQDGECIPLATETPEALAARIADDIDRLDRNEVTLSEEDPIVDGYEAEE